MARGQDNRIRLSVENLEGRNLTTSLSVSGSTLVVRITDASAEYQNNIKQFGLALHNYDGQTGFFLR
jgi:hypothetical protein